MQSLNFHVKLKCLIFGLKAKKGEPENTPDEIISMVKSLASPPHRIILFLQQSSVEWCSSLWLDAIRDIDPTFRRTVVVVSKFDNRLKVQLQNPLCGFQFVNFDDCMSSLK